MMIIYMIHQTYPCIQPCYYLITRMHTKIKYQILIVYNRIKIVYSANLLA